jgi:hypothetical protein
MRFPRRDGTCCHDRVELRNGTKHWRRASMCYRHPPIRARPATTLFGSSGNIDFSEASQQASIAILGHIAPAAICIRVPGVSNRIRAEPHTQSAYRLQWHCLRQNQYNSCHDF